ncbi:neurotrimin isoform X1 [Ptiloglossa arizonensis]|uniref:neurotrimin isoform X1 n=1 Tax=Ptiloglossa arizonensis TaxID=3350558 RepID=UPI003FA1167C
MKGVLLTLNLLFSVQGLVRGTSDHGMYENRALEPLDRGPYFDVSASHNVTALVGKTATLNCRVRNLGDRTVSWVRHRDIHLLTTGVETYTSDQRFVASHFPRTEDWTLQVRYPQRRDSGTYECQVSTTPPSSLSMHLSVVEPVTSIVGEPEMFINKGSTMNLTCVVRHSPEPPTAIYWTHDREVINYDSPRGGVSVITEKGEVTTSYLLVQRAQPADSGQYTCHPSNANTKTVLVHVLNVPVILTLHSLLDRPIYPLDTRETIPIRRRMPRWNSI